MFLRFGYNNVKHYMSRVFLIVYESRISLMLPIYVTSNGMQVSNIVGRVSDGKKRYHTAKNITSGGKIAGVVM